MNFAIILLTKNIFPAVKTVLFCLQWKDYLLEVENVHELCI